MTIKRKICFAALLTTLFLSAVFVCAHSVAAAENDDNPVNFIMPSTTEGTGTHFKITDSSYLNISLDSVASIHTRIESAPSIITMMIESVSESVTSTEITIGGFVPLTTYYKYQDDFHNLEEFIADENGNYSYIQDLSERHFIFIQTQPSTKFIKDNATGGDCASMGIWDVTTKTCTLTTDVNQIIQIDNNGITLDGNNKWVDGSTAGVFTAGVYALYKTGLTIKNINVKNFYYGIYLLYSPMNIVKQNNITNYTYGIDLFGADHNIVSNNFIDIGNASCANGVMLYQSNYNFVNANSIKGNSCTSGIYGSIITNNFFYDNTIINNGTGINLNYYANNTVYHNNFINNASQARFYYNVGGNKFNLDLHNGGGNYWGNFSSPNQGCYDSNFDNICDSPYYLWPPYLFYGTDDFPWTKQDGWKTPAQPPQFWSEINPPDNTLNFQQSFGSGGEVIKILPKGWAIKVLQTKDSNGNYFDQDGFRWYQVMDATDGAVGWMKAGELQDGKVAIEYLSYDSNKQSELEAKASYQIIDVDERKNKIIEAVNDLTATDSRYSVFNNDMWKKLILGVTAQESKGIDFDNGYVSYDYGHGIVQITFQALSNEPNNFDKNQWDNRGKGSSVQIPLCRNINIDINGKITGSNEYMKCYSNAGTGNTNPKPYKPYNNIATNPTYKQYSNTSQSIYANINDGLAF